MTAEEKQAEAPASSKRRGPRKESEIRAEVEAQLREELEAKVRAELLAEQEAKEREAERQRALAAEARPIKADAVDGDPTAEGALTVHFVEDGLTLLGKVWLRGEELTINPGTPQWEEVHSVLSLDEYEQEARWNRRYFREGPWRGKRWDEIDDELLTDAEREQLRKAEQLRQEKYGPVLRN